MFMCAIHGHSNSVTVGFISAEISKATVIFNICMQGKRDLCLLVTIKASNQIYSV